MRLKMELRKKCHINHPWLPKHTRVQSSVNSWKQNSCDKLSPCPSNCQTHQTYQQTKTHHKPAQPDHQWNIHLEATDTQDNPITQVPTTTANAQRIAPRRTKTTTQSTEDMQSTTTDTSQSNATKQTHTIPTYTKEASETNKPADDVLKPRQHSQNAEDTAVARTEQADTESAVPPEEHRGVTEGDMNEADPAEMEPRNPPKKKNRRMD